MPLYEYRCEACGHQFEVIQKFSDEPIAVCPKCGSGPVVKLLSSPAFQFKGTGWYITDYARKGTSEGKDGEGQAGEGIEGRSKKDDAKSTPTSTTDSSASTDPEHAETHQHPERAHHAAPHRQCARRSSSSLSVGCCFATATPSNTP